MFPINGEPSPFWKLNSRSQLAGIAVACLLFARIVGAQDAKFSAGVTVVNLLATVKDSDGRIVHNLDRDDFVLEEEGIPQTIRYFSRESNLPLTVGLLVDTSRSVRRVLDAERQASSEFLERVLREDRDAAFVAHFDVGVGVPHVVTSSHEQLQLAIGQLHPGNLGGTRLFDAIKKSSEELMKSRPGRKAFIVLSDGGDYHSRASIVTAIEYAQRADTFIYAILFAASPPVVPSRHPPQWVVEQAKGRRNMQRLAMETGGGYFAGSDSGQLAGIYREIEDELRNQYSIGYVPSSGKNGVAYRKIHMAVRDKKLRVQTRAGYYP